MSFPEGFYNAVAEIQSRVPLPNSTSPQDTLDRTGEAVITLAEDLRANSWLAGVLRKNPPATRTARGYSADTLVLFYENVYYEFDVVKDAEGADGDPRWIKLNGTPTLLRWAPGQVEYPSPIDRVPPTPLPSQPSDNNPEPFEEMIRIAVQEAVRAELQGFLGRLSRAEIVLNNRWFGETRGKIVIPAGE